MNNLIETFEVPVDVRKRTNLGTTQFYEKIEIYDNKMVGYNSGKEAVT